MFLKVIVLSIFRVKPVRKRVEREKRRELHSDCLILKMM
jgi:hypothetical protein